LVNFDHIEWRHILLATVSQCYGYLASHKSNQY